MEARSWKYISSIYGWRVKTHVPLVPSLPAPSASVPVPPASEPPSAVITSSTAPPSTVHNTEVGSTTQQPLDFPSPAIEVFETEVPGVDVPVGKVPVSEAPLAETSAVEVPMNAKIVSGDAPSSSSTVPHVASQVETSSIDTPIAVVENQPASVGDVVPVELADDPSSVPVWKTVFKVLEFI
ncbi:PREDICTED: predicted GPI-anchored protein 58 [Nicotiana attenuata]|uniref:predicted GPI-anchored protein 58 n=1 Tax=Nicotiana attenuata TaxID=49451 RepID=UPI0009055EDA|nr:PREDICTED: predicted GPI-anchored protein 58 [Nicotiana attenuata]